MARAGTSTNRAAVYAPLTMSVIVTDCVFANNIATNGNVTPKEHIALWYAYYIGRLSQSPVCWGIVFGVSREYQLWQAISPAV